MEGHKVFIIVIRKMLGYLGVDQRQTDPVVREHCPTLTPEFCELFNYVHGKLGLLNVALLVSLGGQGASPRQRNPVGVVQVLTLGLSLTECQHLQEGKKARVVITSIFDPYLFGTTLLLRKDTIIAGNVKS